VAHYPDTRIGRFLRALTRRNVIAIIVGVLLAGAPLVAFDIWAGAVIDRQGQEEVETSAKRAISLAESRVNQVMDALDQLAAREVDSCRLSDIAEMREANFATTPIKEVAVVAYDGQTLCTDLGLPLARRRCCPPSR
jgi:sensor c-di-GMP phosphodiesterase-like protein